MSVSTPPKIQSSSAGVRTAGHCSSVDQVYDLLGAGLGQALTESSDGKTSSSAAAPGPPCILQIDDDPDFCQAMKLRLEKHGVAVLQAWEGTKGFHAAMTKPADAILLDIEMPNGAGDYILRRLKENPLTRDLPVFVITATTSRSLERKLLNMGAERIFLKPLDFDRLLRELSFYMPIDRRAGQD